MDRTAYKNRHIKEHYDRINLVIPKGEKDRIKNACSEIGASVNEYLYMLVCNDLAGGNTEEKKRSEIMEIKDLKQFLKTWEFSDIKRKRGKFIMEYKHI